MTGRRRLHPAGIAVLAARTLRGAAFPALIGLGAMVGGTGFDAASLVRGAVFALVATLAAATVGYLTWRTASYEVSDRAVSARRGILAARETVIPLDRVQAVDTVQGPLQRVFGVTEVHVQAAGGGREGEIVLEALSPAAVAELRAVVGRPAGDAAAPAPEPDAVRRLGTRELLVAALTSGQLAVIAPVLAGATQVIDDLGGDDPTALAERIGLSTDAEPTAATLVAAGLAVLALAWLLSIAGAIVAFAGFTATRDGERLLIRRGVLARREASLPLARVQAVTVVEGLLRQPFGLAALRVEVAGYATEAGAAQTLFPLVRARDVEAVLAALVPALAGPAAPLEPAPSRARRRYLTSPLLLAAPVSLWLAVTLGPGWLLLLAPAAAKGLLDHRAAGWRLEEDRVLLRSRRLARRTVIVSRRRVQRHEIRENPFQRRAGLAGFALAAGAGTRERVAHLDRPVAQRLFDALR